MGILFKKMGIFGKKMGIFGRKGGNFVFKNRELDYFGKKSLSDVSENLEFEVVYCHMGMAWEWDFI